MADLRKSSAEALEKELGSMGYFLWDLAHGRDDRTVESEWDPKSSGTERTFAEDIISIPELSDVLDELCQEIAETLKERHWFAMTFTLKVKYFDFKQITRSVTFSIPSDKASFIFQNLKTLLLEKTEAGRTPIRLLGVSASSLILEDDPLQLFFEFMND